MNHPPLNLTPLWHQSHPHLTLWPEFAHHPNGQRCPLCSQSAAHPVQVRLTLADGKQQTSLLLHCASCQGITLSPLSAPLQTPPMPHPQEIVAIEARLWRASPRFFNLEPTNRCNFSCFYCIGRHLPQQDLAYEAFCRILDHAPGIETLALVGEGEPLMNKAFWAMATEAKARGIAVVIVSNGSTLSASNIAKLCQAEIRYVAISIDSHDPATFADSRTGGDLTQILANIAALRRYRDSHGYRYPKIGLKGTLFRHTRDQLPAIARMAAEAGVELFESFQPLNPMRTYRPIYPKERTPELDHIAEVSAAITRDMPQAFTHLRPVWEWAAEEGLTIPTPESGHPAGPHCDETGLYVLANGDLTPCCQIKAAPTRANWNLLDRPLSAILADPEYQRWRYHLYNGLFPSQCQGCYKSLCANTPDPQ